MSFLQRHRWSIARRIVQIAALTLFIGTVRFGWTLFGKPILAGDFTASHIFDVVPLSDPFTALQKLFAWQPLPVSMIVGSLIVLTVYWLFGGRSFCAWMCPMNLVTDLANFLRPKLHLRTDLIRIDPRVRYVIAIGCLFASLGTGTAAFEWISPQAFLWREAIWGIGLGFFAAVLGVFALDMLLIKRGWCGHLCPLGAFWSAVGKAGVIKPLFDADRCTRCGKCIPICPEPQVLNLNKAGERGFVAGGECTNCGRCVEVCADHALAFGPRWLAHPTSRSHNQEKPL